MPRSAQSITMPRKTPTAPISKYTPSSQAPKTRMVHMLKMDTAVTYMICPPARSPWEVEKAGGQKNGIVSIFMRSMVLATSAASGVGLYIDTIDGMRKNSTADTQGNADESYAF